MLVERDNFVRRLIATLVFRVISKRVPTLVRSPSGSHRARVCEPVRSESLPINDRLA
jgi:hypothetical protein